MRQKPEQYLVLNPKYRGNTHSLKVRILRDGVKEHRCEGKDCGLTEWHGRPIPLELHHKNGNVRDNRFENLKLLCPNCHALEPNNSGGGHSWVHSEEMQMSLFVRHDRLKDFLSTGWVLGRKMEL